MLTLLAGCGADVSPSASSSAPIDSPTASLTAAPPPGSAVATASSPVRPSPYPGAPAIADPFWLLHTGHDSATWKDKNGTVIRRDDGESYQVINGGSLEQTILIDGTVVGTPEIITTTGDSGSGLSPIEEQSKP